MSSLHSKIFQYNFFNVNNIELIVKTEIIQIKILFINKMTNLNIYIFYEIFKYNILFNFNPKVGI